MSVARTARRRRKQMTSNNAQWSGLRVPRYGRASDADARTKRIQREKAKAARMGKSYGFST